MIEILRGGPGEKASLLGELHHLLELPVGEDGVSHEIDFLDLGFPALMSHERHGLLPGCHFLHLDLHLRVQETLLPQHLLQGFLGLADPGVVHRRAPSDVGLLLLQLFVDLGGREGLDVLVLHVRDERTVLHVPEDDFSFLSLPDLQRDVVEEVQVPEALILLPQGLLVVGIPLLDGELAHERRGGNADVAVHHHPFNGLGLSPDAFHAEEDQQTCQGFPQVTRQHAWQSLRFLSGPGKGMGPAGLTEGC